MQQKINIVQAYIKELKGVDVKIYISDHRNLMMLEMAYNIAQNYFNTKVS